MDPFVYMLDREAVGLVVNQLFYSLDNREWSSLQECFSPRVEFDITSLIGGEKHHLRPEQIATLWNNSLSEVQHLQHQITNLTVFVQNERATSHFYCSEIHFKQLPSGNNTRSLNGSYDIHLTKESGVWKIHLFRYNHKFISGNAALKS
ncbi:MAG: nuclear transport factor 2 family protein [Flavobacteriales bacterium]